MESTTLDRSRVDSHTKRLSQRGRRCIERAAPLGCGDVAVTVAARPGSCIERRGGSSRVGAATRWSVRLERLRGRDRTPGDLEPPTNTRRIDVAHIHHKRVAHRCLRPESDLIDTESFARGEARASRPNWTWANRFQSASIPLIKVASSTTRRSCSP